MPFITAGFPSLDVTAEAIPALEAAGASVVELGIPFSDPIADGPVIAASMHEALLSGVTPSSVLEVVRQVRGRVTIGLIAMVSYSIVERMGVERFIDEAASAGVDGLILPDIDFAAAGRVGSMAEARGLSFSLLIAPTTPEDRIAELTKACRGFVYVLARTGITGERSAAPEVAERVEIIRRHTDLPLAVGFGISTAEHVAAVTEVAEAAIVGSALVRRMTEAADPIAAAASYTAALAAGLSKRPVRP